MSNAWIRNTTEDDLEKLAKSVIKELDKSTRKVIIYKDVISLRDYASSLAKKVDISKTKGEDTSIYRKEVDDIIYILGYFLDVPNFDSEKEFDDKYKSIKEKMAKNGIHDK